jgi:hypothetical protein
LNQEAVGGIPIILFTGSMGPQMLPRNPSRKKSQGGELLNLSRTCHLPKNGSKGPWRGIPEARSKTFIIWEFDYSLGQS